MKKGEFINIAKRMVKEYFNRYVDKENIIKKIDVKVNKFVEEENVYRIILDTPGRDDTFYGVTYHKDTGEFNSFIYKKIDDNTIGAKII